MAAAIQKCVTDEVMGIGQKVCALIGSVILRALRNMARAQLSL